MLTNYISIRLNGKPFNCIPNFLLVDLLAYLNIDINSIIVEYNGEIIEESLFNGTLLQQGDKLEILTVVGGG